MEGVEVKVEVDIYEDDPVPEENGLVGFLAEQQLAGLISPSVNRNLYLVPEDLQQLIVESNPGRAKFTISQRLNTQLVWDDYVLKKKLGPEVRKVSLICNIHSERFTYHTTYTIHSGIPCDQMDLLEEELPVLSDLT